jgi:hypothetical protein
MNKPSYTLCIDTSTLSPVTQAILRQIKPADGTSYFHLEGKLSDGSKLVVLIGNGVHQVDRAESEMPTMIGVGKPSQHELTKVGIRK